MQERMIDPASYGIATGFDDSGSGFAGKNTGPIDLVYDTL